MTDGGINLRIAKLAQARRVIAEQKAIEAELLGEILAEVGESGKLETTLYKISAKATTNWSMAEGVKVGDLPPELVSSKLNTTAAPKLVAQDAAKYAPYLVSKEGKPRVSITYADSGETVA